MKKNELKLTFSMISVKKTSHNECGFLPLRVDAI